MKKPIPRAAAAAAVSVAVPPPAGPSKAQVSFNCADVGCKVTYLNLLSIYSFGAKHNQC